MIERINERLGHPDRCPHGWPVDTAVEHAENPELVSLSALQAGERATVVRLAEHDGELLHWFYSEGLVPGSTIDVHTARGASGEMGVAVEGNERAVGEAAAEGLFVRKL
jgi:DtxR family Mn-dependent transcriptional regulator